MTRHQRSSLVAVVAIALATTVWSAQRAASPPPWPKGNPQHRAIFCGHPWTEGTTKEYSEALLEELRRLETTGRNRGEAWMQVRMQADCERGIDRRTR